MKKNDKTIYVGMKQAIKRALDMSPFPLVPRAPWAHGFQSYIQSQSLSQSFYLKNSISILISVFTSSIFQYFSSYFNKMPKDNLFI